MADFTEYRVQQDHQIPIRSPNSVQVETGIGYLKTLEKNLKIEIVSHDKDTLEFDLIGVDPSIANALRRILIAEVPTMAIEKVWIAENSSIIQDEVLSHRIGLIPIKADPKKLSFVENDEETDNDTLVFNFEVECKNETTGKTNRNGDPIYVNEHALSKDLVWIPEGNQLEMFPEGIAPVHDDIVIAKLKPGQRIEFEAHCVKGVGKDHAKFSPVATASYRLLPEITFAEPITGERAQELKSMCPQNVFDIEDMEAVVARPRECTMCRECIRKDGWHDSVQLKRKADYFLFTIESTGCMPTETIVREAILILKQKSIKFQKEVEKFEQSQI